MTDIGSQLDLAAGVAHDARMSTEWRELAVFADRASAEVLVGLLRSESIDSRIVADEPVPGLIRSIAVSVPVHQWTQAREIRARAQMSDEEWAHYLDRQVDGEVGQEEENDE